MRSSQTLLHRPQRNRHGRNDEAVASGAKRPARQRHPYRRQAAARCRAAAAAGESADRSLTRRRYLRRSATLHAAPRDMLSANSRARAHVLCLPLNSGFSRSASGDVLSRLGTGSRSGGLLQTSRSNRDRLVGAQTEASARSRRIDVASACGHVDAWARSERRPKSGPTNVSTTAPLEAQPDLRPGAPRSACGVRLAPAEPNRLRRSTAPSGARTRTSALRRSSEGGCLQRDPCCSTTQINGRVTEKWLHAHFRAKPGHEKSLRVAGLSHSGGGIRTRDLRVMGRLRGGQLPVVLQVFSDFR
jgi:hypothetical protein